MSMLFPSTANGTHLETIADVQVTVVQLTSGHSRAIVYLHGGGFIAGSPRSHRQHLKRLARTCHAIVYAIDYGLAPESPYPVALDEIQGVWTTLTANHRIDPRHTIFMGDSAGGNLALASLIRFRHGQLPLPNGLVLLSPGLDATLSGESYAQQDSIDPLLNRQKLQQFVNSYVGDHSKRDPTVSPIFADLHGLPPLLVHVGSNELLLSDSLAIAAHAKRDGVDATLFVGQGLWHGWHFHAMYVPEARLAMNNVAAFVTQHT